MKPPVFFKPPLIKRTAHAVIISVKFPVSVLVRDRGHLNEFTSVCRCVFWTLIQAEY